MIEFHRNEKKLKKVAKQFCRSKFHNEPKIVERKLKRKESSSERAEEYEKETAKDCDQSTS